MQNGAQLIWSLNSPLVQQNNIYSLFRLIHRVLASISVIHTERHRETGLVRREDAPLESGDMTWNQVREATVGIKWVPHPAVRDSPP